MQEKLYQLIVRYSDAGSTVTVADIVAYLQAIFLFVLSRLSYCNLCRLMLSSHCVQQHDK